MFAFGERMVQTTLRQYKGSESKFRAKHQDGHTLTVSDTEAIFEEEPFEAEYIPPDGKEYGCSGFGHTWRAALLNLLQNMRSAENASSDNHLVV